MVILLLPLLAIGALAYASGRRAQARRAQADRRPLALAAPVVGALPPALGLPPGGHGGGPPSPPSPLAVLDYYLQSGQTPPPPVILCAIAQAEILGQLDLAADLVRAFVQPVVEQAVRQGQQHGYGQGQGSGRGHHHGHHPGQGHTPQHHVPQHPWYPHVDVGPGYPDYHQQPGAGAPADPGAPPQGGPQGPWDPSQHAAPEYHPAHPGHPDPADPAAEVPSPVASPAPAPQTLTVSGRSSPIDGVDGQDWAAFAARVSREQPTFMSQHHVGQFRQRRSRLAELGLDPDQVAQSIEDQHRALDTDMADAYRHACDSGLVAEFQGHVVEVPAQGGSAPIEVTLSGVLGVIQAAGLEGAVEWFERPADRRRFRGTTEQFLRTNGVF